jgi:CheY-like chemotaxis protein
VLVVEDDVLLRMDALQMLNDAGYQVLEAAHADEAITILEARLDITIVFTDIDMPGSMDGIKLAQAVRGRWPPIKIVVTSGHSIPAKGEMPFDSIFIPKPYSSRIVLGAISGLIAV